MRRLMLLLLFLISMTIMADSLPSVHLGGNSGITLLKGLTNVSENITTLNSTMINLSGSRAQVPLSGNNGTILLNDLSKSPANLSFGSKPRTPPPPPVLDYKAIELYNILRQNHVGD